MATISSNVVSDWTAELDVLRCVACAGRIQAGATTASPGAEPAFACVDCGRVYPTQDGVLIVKEELAPENRIAADFYNGGRSGPSSGSGSGCSG